MKEELRLRHRRRTWFDYFLVILLLFIILVTIYPFWHQLVISFDGGYSAFEAGFKLWPSKLSLGAYKIVMSYSTLWTGFFNSVVRVALGVTSTLFLTTLTAYPLSKKDLPFKGFYTGFLFVTMLIGGGLIPNYLLIRNLGMFNTIWALVIPGALSAYNVFIVRNFFKTLPDGVEESALIDGAGWLTVYIRIVLPMSVPVLAVIALWSAVGHWNAWFDAMLYMQRPNMVTLPLVLRRVLIEDSEAGLRKMTELAAKGTKIQGKNVEAAILIISLVPMLIVYPFLQKYFVTGINMGAIKG